MWDALPNLKKGGADRIAAIVAAAVFRGSDSIMHRTPGAPTDREPIFELVPPQLLPNSAATQMVLGAKTNE